MSAQEMACVAETVIPSVMGAPRVIGNSLTPCPRLPRQLRGGMIYVSRRDSAILPGRTIHATLR